MGKLKPDCELWKHIIIPAGGHVVVTSGSKTEDVKNLVAEEGEGMRLCVMNEKPKHSRLVDYLDESNFIFVTTAYVAATFPPSSLVVGLSEQEAPSRYL